MQEKKVEWKKKKMTEVRFSWVRFLFKVILIIACIAFLAACTGGSIGTVDWKQWSDFFHNPAAINRAFGFVWEVF